MHTTLNRTANIHARIRPDIKTNASDVLKKLGISMSQFIELSLKHIIKEKAVQFEIELMSDDTPDQYEAIANIEDFNKIIDLS